MSPSRYKQTLMDRHGPEGALRIKAFAYAIMVFGLSVGALLLAGQGAPPPLLLTLVFSITLSLLTYFGALKFGGLAGDATQYVTAGGSSTPYEEQFSHEQALVMQRDYAGALNLFEQRIAQSPGEPRCRIAAADLYATHGANPVRAAELYREVQRVEGIASGHDIYVSHRLADLYLGPLNDPGRALVEFRRLIERYPGSTAADNARTALTNVKARMQQGTERPPEQPW